MGQYQVMQERPQLGSSHVQNRKKKFKQAKYDNTSNSGHKSSSYNYEGGQQSVNLLNSNLPPTSGFREQLQCEMQRVNSLDNTKQICQKTPQPTGNHSIKLPPSNDPMYREQVHLPDISNGSVSS